MTKCNMQRIQLNFVLLLMQKLNNNNTKKKEKNEKEGVRLKHCNGVWAKITKNVCTIKRSERGLLRYVFCHY